MGTTEHNHIDLSKKPACHTQMRADTFDSQVANCLVDNFMVDLADCTMSAASHTNSDSLPSLDGIPHNSDVFDMLF